MNRVELLARWLTPNVLFCLLNLMIGVIFVISSLKTNKQPKTSDDEHLPPPQISRVPSILERVSSIKLPYQHRPENPNPLSVPAQKPENPEPCKNNTGHITRSESDLVTKTPAISTEMRKSASERIASAASESEEEDRLPPAALRGEEEAVDAKAEDFINRFKQQLKMQRLNSLLRYKEMLKGGR